MTGAVLLLPCGLVTGAALATLPAATLALARQTEHVLAENAKSARALLKEIGHPRPISELKIVEIGHAPEPAAIDRCLAPALAGSDVAIVSEAGCPGVADPGATIVARAHALGLRVRPLTGPSSLLLALMGAGGNGQRFRFVGYLPQDAAQRVKALRELEAAARSGETQLFIETPYRNDKMFGAILATCAPATLLSLAVDLTAADELVVTRTIAQWRALASADRPRLNKRPAVFTLPGAVR
ncbi:MAG: SAM-dependent methyltransferase [Burkholderiales bacterium]|jgi:16S rRNA (cytidine1402-2'-O)-methyltransferase|nr:SAM-dependent methyltransferase [Burkholderiales bacterium]